MKRLAAAAFAVVALSAAVAVLWPAAPPAEPAGLPKRTTQAPQAPVPQPMAPAVHAAVSTPAPPLRCAGAVLEVQSAHGPQRACLDEARLVQNGDLRTWHAEAMPWRLEVDLEAEAVVAARLLAPGRPAAACAAAGCAGIALGPRDGHGQRRLQLQRVSFHAGGEPLAVSADLPLPPAADAGPCEADAVQVSLDQGGAWRFCASAASAVALGDDGRRHYHLRSLAGETLRVVLEADGGLAEIALGSWRCSAWHCSGATLAPAAEDGLALMLAGVPLRQGTQAARLQGQLQLPAPQ